MYEANEREVRENMGGKDAEGAMRTGGRSHAGLSRRWSPPYRDHETTPCMRLNDSLKNQSIDTGT